MENNFENTCLLSLALHRVCKFVTYNKNNEYNMNNNVYKARFGTELE